ncbi:radical SAM protein [Patescibacteria group bacterium]|nr:radical SAM protein [Patescibacteria group bacterium]
MNKNIGSIKRKTLLYKSKVDYGGWTINHIVGCTHGCRFPCYAFMMAKRFGWVKDYNDWRTPKLVSNALELLEKELENLKEEVSVVHLCFMTDPFMYDDTKNILIPEVKEMTLKIIKKLNDEGIRVTTLTKGLYPEEILESPYSIDNEYGITLVSLNNAFKERFEPFSSSYDERLLSLKRLSDVGRKTWISMEPYPTPNIDATAENIEYLLDKISFVDKIIFGKLNYNVGSSKYSGNDVFYRTVAGKIVDFCDARDIQYHIKTGTPLSEKSTVKILQHVGVNK